MGSTDSKTSADTATDPKTSECTFDWDLEIQEGEHSIGQCIISKPFNTADSEGPIWQLLLYPSGYMEDIQDYIAVFLQCLSKEYDHISAIFKITLHSDKRQLCYRHKNVNVPCSRAMGWFAFLKRTDANIPGKLKKMRLTCELSARCTKKNTQPPLEEISGIGSNLSDDGELSADFSALYEGETFSDVTLNVEGQNIKAHKVILAARSPVFYCIFTEQKSTLDFLIMPKVSFRTCERLVKFLYTGKTEEFTVQSAMDLYDVAHNYAVFALTDICIVYLKSHYEVQNAADVLQFANKFREIELKNLVVDFIFKNFKDVADTSAWQSVLKTDPVLGSEVLCYIDTNLQQN